MKVFRSLSLMAMVAMLGVGCSSMEGRQTKSGPFPGVRAWPAVTKRVMITRSPNDNLFILPLSPPFCVPFVVMDFSVAAALDVVVLPIDCINLIPAPHWEETPTNSAPPMRTPETNFKAGMTRDSVMTSRPENVEAAGQGCLHQVSNNGKEMTR